MAVHKYNCESATRELVEEVDNRELRSGKKGNVINLFTLCLHYIMNPICFERMTISISL